MPDYKDSKIYKIISLSNPELVYYGSTTQKLNQRLAKHKSDMKSNKTSCSSFEVLNQPDVTIVLVESYPCNSKEELHAREAYYIQNNKCVNKCVPGRDRKQYKQDNKEKIKKYYEDNKEKIKQWYLDNKEQLQEYYKQYYQDHKQQKKEYHKKWYEDNKEKIREKAKQYRQDNKEKIQERHKQYYESNKEKINTKSNCPICDKTMLKFSIPKHIKTIHKELIEQ